MRTTFVAFAILLILGMIHVFALPKSVHTDALRNRKKKIMQSKKGTTQPYSLAKEV